MTTQPNPPSDPSGNTSGPGATIVEGRLSDLAVSVHDPATDMVVPVLRMQDWDRVDETRGMLQSVVALYSLRLADDAVAANEKRSRSRRRAAAIQRPFKEAAVDPLRQVYGAVSDSTWLEAARAHASYFQEKERVTAFSKNLDATVKESARVTRFLQDRFRNLDLSKPVDLRAIWFAIRDQGKASGCVGYAVADAIQLQRRDSFSVPSARFIWQAAKELDGEKKPTTMIAGAGTSLRAGLQVVQRYGFALESELPSENNALYEGGIDGFYRLIRTRKIHRFVNLGNDVKHRLAWLSLGRPIVCALRAGRNFLRASGPDAVVAPELPDDRNIFAHAVVIVGYRVEEGRTVTPRSIGDLDVRDASSLPNDPQDRPVDELPIQYLIRNCAGPKWGDHGYAWARHVDLFRQFTEEYGIFSDEDELPATMKEFAERPIQRGEAPRGGRKEISAS